MKYIAQVVDNFMMWLATILIVLLVILFYASPIILCGFLAWLDSR